MWRCRHTHALSGRSDEAGQAMMAADIKQPAGGWITMESGCGGRIRTGDLNGYEPCALTAAPLRQAPMPSEEKAGKDFFSHAATIVPVRAPGRARHSPAVMARLNGGAAAHEWHARLHQLPLAGKRGPGGGGRRVELSRGPAGDIGGIGPLDGRWLAPMAAGCGACLPSVAAGIGVS